MTVDELIEKLNHFSKLGWGKCKVKVNIPISSLNFDYSGSKDISHLQIDQLGIYPAEILIEPK